MLAILNCSWQDAHTQVMHDVASGLVVLRVVTQVVVHDLGVRIKQLGHVGHAHMAFLGQFPIDDDALFDFTATGSYPLRSHMNERAGRVVRLHADDVGFIGDATSAFNDLVNKHRRCEERRALQDMSLFEHGWGDGRELLG